MKPWAIGLFLGLLIVVTISVFFSCNGPPDRDSPIVVQAELNPQWDYSEPEIADPDSIAHEFHLLWDRSIPMGGYVHRTDPDSQATLGLINHLLKSARLTTEFGGGGASLKCLGITDSITSVDCDSALLRGFFNGNNSRLDQGIEYVIGGLNSGALKGAALVSDLIATTIYGTGAVALLPFLNNSTIRAQYNSGKIDLALIGIRIDYWGVHMGTCRTMSGSIGCWFDELEKRYRSLDKKSKRPIYVLIMGRRSEGETRENNSVHKMATEFLNAITSQGLEMVKHEIVTQGPLGSQTEFKWYPYATTGYQKVGLTHRGYYCKDNGTHGLVGRFADSLLSITDIEMHGSVETIAASADIEYAHQVNLELNCKTLREQLREERSGLCNDTPNELKGIVEYQGQRDWAEWSSDSHRSDLTPGLTQFINGIRPSRYEVIIEPALPLEACESD